MRIPNSRISSRLLLAVVLATAVRETQARQPNQGSSMIPRGTVITVRTIDPIKSKSAKAGDTFRASVDEPVTVNGRELIARGADAEMRLYQVNSKSRDLTLRLYSVNVRGKQVYVNTEAAVVTAEKKGMSGGAKTAIGAGAGALIGGIAGGGKGALIGAGAGAGTGLVISAATGRDSEVKPETRLSFTTR